MKKLFVMFVVGASVLSASVSFAAVDASSKANPKAPCPALSAKGGWPSSTTNRITPPRATEEVKEATVRTRDVRS